MAEISVVQPTELHIATNMDDVYEAVRKQMEFYFSKENLMTDSFLVSQMDSNKSVPISVVMKVIHSLFSI